MNIGVFFGSRSPEHDISIITGQFIISGLRDLGYQVVPVYLSKKGEWLLGEELGTLKTFTDPEIKIDLKKFGKYYLDLEGSIGKLVFKKKGTFGKSMAIDLAFPAFHGTNGEDGTIQGLFEIFDLPYVGCDVTSSAIAMDKVLTKQLYEHHHIPTTKFIYFTRTEWVKNKEILCEQIRKEFEGAVFVKPARLGSSIGIAKVTDNSRKDLEYRIEVALHYDEKVLVEEAVENLMDVTCCVMGNEQPIPSFLQESVFDSELFDFEEKYLKEGGTQLGKAQNKLVIPARLDAKISWEIQDMAVKIFKLFGCSGITRVDFLYDNKTGKYFANELNPLPGTLYHHLWKASGINLGELLQKLIGFAKERSEMRHKVTSTFESDLLKITNSQKLGLKKN